MDARKIGLLIGLVAVMGSGAQAGPPNQKKGVGFWNADGKAARLAPAVDELGNSWYYNWTPKPDINGRAIKAEFVPMIWHGGHATPETMAALKKAGYKTVLGFNEPDGKTQANMTVAEAIELWPVLMKPGLRLGSPAPAHAHADGNDWLGEFMREAKKRRYRVDFICLHWYGDVTAPDAVERLRKFLETQWKLYRKPIWLTEFSGCTGYWLRLENPPLTREKNAEFIRKALPMLKSLPYVERYAWFELAYTQPPWAKVALVYPRTGKPTVAGEAWRDAGK